MNHLEWSDKLDWLDLNLGPVSHEDTARQKVTASALIDHLFGHSSVPGLILADEVGMGKTFVSLAVAASVFKWFGNEISVIVLSPSRQMRQVWNDRWNLLRSKQVKLTLPSGCIIDNVRKVPPGISFGSYEEMKNTTGREVRAAFNQAILGLDRPRGDNRRKLMKGLFESQRLDEVPEPAEVNFSLSNTKLDNFWRKNYDPNFPDEWINPRAAYRHLQRLILSTRRPKGPGAKLVIFDEAHRLAGEQRRAFLSEVLSSKSERILLVTATPFSLDVDELLDRIEDLYVATGNDGEQEIEELSTVLEKFRDIVRSRDVLNPEIKSVVESKLRRYLIRNTWSDSWKDGTPRRKPAPEKVPAELIAPEDQTFAMLALEKLFVDRQAEGNRTFIATHRETLCSSYGAIRHSNDKYGYFDELMKILPSKVSGKESPKFEHALNVIERIVRSGSIEPNKIVVFCDRNETIRLMRKFLANRFSRDQEIAAAKWNSLRESLQRRQWNGDYSKARFACYTLPEVNASSIDDSLKRIHEKLASSKPETDYWRETWGPGRHVDWIATITGEMGEGDRLPEHVQFAFNLPGPPYVLISSQKGRESIDLHLWCRRIMHYDLDWNPSVMEQRVGRVDRINSLAQRTMQPIEIYLIDVAGTYEERILSRVKERMEMKRVLLGAGEWLRESDDTPETFDDLISYRLDFSPETHNVQSHPISHVVTSVISFVKRKME